MLQEILTLNVFGFLLIFARVGTALMILPGFSGIQVPRRIRLMMGLTVSFVLAPALAGRLPGLPASVPGLLLIILGEVVVGAFLGTIGRILIAALQTAGTLIALLSSMANALIRDPIAEQQSSVVASFLSTLGLLLIFVTDTHHLMLRAVSDSYTLFVPAQPLAFGDMALMVGRRVADSFALGLQLSTPILIAGLTYYIGLGILGRLMPQLPVFFFGLPIQLAMQISVLMLALSGLMLAFLAAFQQGFGAFIAP